MFVLDEISMVDCDVLEEVAVISNVACLFSVFCWWRLPPSIQACIAYSTACASHVGCLQHASWSAMLAPEQRDRASMPAASQRVLCAVVTDYQLTAFHPAG